MVQQHPQPYPIATFAAGCFWGVEAAFRRLPGVIETRVGYTGGTWENPCYLDVCGGMTGHVEAVQVQYDPQTISYNDLLATFWSIHNPTKRDNEAPDKGPQYRSMIVTHTPEQAELAFQSKQQQMQSGQFQRDILTQIRPAMTFYPAEDYHQQYLNKRRNRTMSEQV